MQNKRRIPVFVKIIIFVAVLIAIVGIVGAYIYINRYVPVPDGVMGNTSGNINNHGMFCESDGYVYFSNPYDGRKLYKMNPDGTNAVCICDVPCEYINVYGKNVYFYQTPGADDQVFGLGGLYGICQTDINGKTGLDNLDKTICNQMIMYGDNLYYQHYDAKEGLTLYKASCDGKNKEKISDLEVYVSSPYQNSFLTYDTDSMYNLCAYNPETDSMVQLDSSTRAYNIALSGQYAYFMNIDDGYRIYRYDINSRTSEKITDDPVDTYNVYGNNIFYQKNTKDEQALMRINSDGSNPQLISYGNYTNINCTSTYTYFCEFGTNSPIYRVPTSGGTDAVVFNPN